MRNPIAVAHQNHQFQVIWRKGRDGANWSHYIDAETDEDAISHARNLMALDSVKYAEEIGNRRNWSIVEVRELDASGNGIDPLYPRRRVAELMGR